jgi:hypothetical protein
MTSETGAMESAQHAPRNASPGFYRFAFGESEITVLSDGHFHFPTDVLAIDDPLEVQGYGVDPYMREAYFRSRLVPSDHIPLQASPVLIDKGSRRTLVDSGWGAGEESPPTGGRLGQSLEATGVSPGSIDQVALTHAHPDHAWVGAGEERVDSQRNEHMMRLYPETDEEIRRMAARCIPYCHSAIMFRRSLLDEGLNYDPSGSLMSDFVFFIEVARLHKVANLPEVLVRRHIRDESYYQRRFNRGMQNRRLARLSLRAVRELDLPKRYCFYPLARLAYPYIPNGPKRLVRRVAGLAEEAARGGQGEGTERAP